MMPVRDFLNRIRWDSSLKKEEYAIFYYDRLCHCLKSFSFLSIKDISKNFVELNDGREIPLHRIREIRRKNKLVWERKAV